jgi:hypothetical protein
MTRHGWTKILGGLVALALAIASRPALAGEPEAAFVHPAWTHAAASRSASLHSLPASLVLSTHRTSRLHHHHHAPHHASLARDLSACGPASLPMHPAGLPHSGRAATAHHAPTVAARQGKGSSRAASFLAERFAWGVDPLSFTVASVERGIPKNQTFDINAGRGPPRAGPFGDSAAYSAFLAFPASTLQHSTHPANSTNPIPSARRFFGAPRSAAAFAFREPALRAAWLGKRCRMNRGRLTPSPAIAAWEARRVA